MFFFQTNIYGDSSAAITARIRRYFISYSLLLLLNSISVKQISLLLARLINCQDVAFDESLLVKQISSTY